jgi:hypothetical protein
MPTAGRITWSTIRGGLAPIAELPDLLTTRIEAALTVARISRPAARRNRISA